MRLQRLYKDKRREQRAGVGVTCDRPTPARFNPTRHSVESPDIAFCMSAVDSAGLVRAPDRMAGDETIRLHGCLQIELQTYENVPDMARVERWPEIEDV